MSGDLKEKYDELLKENQELHDKLEDYTKREMIASIQAKATEVQLENYRFLKKVVDTIDSFLLVVSPEGMILHINAAAAKITGCQAKDAMGYLVGDFFDGLELCDFNDFSEENLKVIGSLDSAVVELKTQDDSRLTILLNSSMLYNGDGEVSGFVFVADVGSLLWFYPLH